MQGQKKNTTKGYFPSNITKDQARDTGMAIVLLCLILSLVFKKKELVFAAIAFLVLNMIWPNAFRYAAKIWLGFSHLLGTIMSRILLSIIYFVMVTPVGLIRKICGSDSMMLKTWKKSTKSVFNSRNHTYSKNDIEHPY
jgi:hypothetical protein